MMRCKPKKPKQKNKMEAIERKEEQINLRKRVRMSEIVRLF